MISIVIPTNRKLIFLKDLLKSINANIQSFKFEIIIVQNNINENIPTSLTTNDSSEDNDLKNTIILKSKNGANTARNVGIQNARNEIVLFLDDDCFIEDPDFFNSHIFSHLDHPEVFAIGGNYKIPIEAKELSKWYVDQQINWLKRSLYDIGVHYLFGGNMSVKKSLFIQNELVFDENIKYGGTETELFVSAKIKNLKSKLLAKPVVHNCRLNLITLIKKSYKQGQGKKYRENKWGKAICDSMYANPTIKTESHKIYHCIQKYFFYLGYNKL